MSFACTIECNHFPLLLKGKVKVLNKINALVRYDILNLRRGKLKWIIAILYLFGVEQSISSMWPSSSFLSLVGFIKVSWLPMNLIMIPLLIIFMKIGKSDNDIFKTIDISHKEFILSKLMIICIISGIILAANIIIAIIIAIICKVSVGYFFYEITGYLINTIIALVVCAAFGLFIGQTICKEVGDILGFILSIIFFLIICNFYKLSNTITPLMNIRTMPNSFDVISYDSRSYIYHIIFWLLLAFILFSLTFLSSFKGEISNKNKLRTVYSILISLGFIAYLGISINSMKPSFYDIGKDSENRITFVADTSCNFHIDKYKMNVTLDKIFKNHCQILLTVDKDNTSSLELGLYDKLNIKSLKLNHENLNLKRTSNSFIVKLPRTYNTGETIELDISYEGVINTTFYQGREFFFVRDNSTYLADAFEWYPKLNDNKIKEYTVAINYNKKNKIYSNLAESNNLTNNTFNGNAGEIYLISGNIKERNYKGILFIGNEEYINSNMQCNDRITRINHGNMKNISKIVLTPCTYEGYSEMNNNYVNSYLYSDY